LKAILDPLYDEIKGGQGANNDTNVNTPRGGIGGIRKKKKRAKWARQKLKTGRRLLIQQGATVIVKDKRRESTDSNVSTN